MGFKVDSSFIRFLTMGARGVQKVCEELRNMGFEPIELERYCGSNKIWATKVKRLRVPDLLCVKTGLRLEVRAKSDLKIKMSDAPNNPDRVWDAGLQDNDIVALIACEEGDDGPEPAEKAVYFSVKSLRGSVHFSKLGAPKSASEGAERDRTWPATVPSRPGVVNYVSDQKIKVTMGGDNQPERNQTYTLNGKTPYVVPGDRFEAKSSILAGAPDEMADISAYLTMQYDPLRDLDSEIDMSRYAAAKALRFRLDLHAHARLPLEERLDTEPDLRIRLEMAGTLVALNSAKGKNYLTSFIEEEGHVDLTMEAIFILTELATPFAKEELHKIASVDRFKGDERRQAAIWGLGKSGLKAYDLLLPFIGDEDENTAFHAIAAFGPDTPNEDIEKLITNLNAGDPVFAPASNLALRIIGSESALKLLVAAVDNDSNVSDWILATIGQFPPQIVKDCLVNNPVVYDRIAPMLLVSKGANWLSSDDAVENMNFLLKQNI